MSTSQPQSRRNALGQPHPLEHRLNKDANSVRRPVVHGLRFVALEVRLDGPQPRPADERHLLAKRPRLLRHTLHALEPRRIDAAAHDERDRLPRLGEYGLVLGLLLDPPLAQELLEKIDSGLEKRHSFRQKTRRGRLYSAAV
jgi:hypothetical protein